MAKQVIIMRKDLKMRRGKEIAQGSHASMAFITRRLSLCENRRDDESDNCVNTHGLQLTEIEQQWLDGGFTKVTLQVDSEEDLMKIHKQAVEAGIQAHLVVDSGKTEFNGVPTKTCLALGPDIDFAIDDITGHLKLY